MSNHPKIDKVLRLDGVIELEGCHPDISNGTAFVVIEDVSLADEDSTIVAELEIDSISHKAGENYSIPFTFCDLELDRGSRYAVRAHISIQNYRSICQGDLVSTETYPVTSCEDCEAKPISIALKTV